MHKTSSRRSFDARGLDDFITDDDRIINPFFVGREDIIARVKKRAQRVNDRRKTKTEGHLAEELMQLIQGPPGVGKTSILREIEHRCIQDLKSDDRLSKARVIPIVVSDSKRLSIEHVHRCLQQGAQNVMDRVGHGEAREVLRDVLSFVQDATIFGVRCGRPTADASDRLRLPKDCTILLMIDEIQAVPDDPKEAAAEALQLLESGSNGQPIMPVLAGLSNSRTVLYDLGLSRVGGRATRPIPPLTKAEVAHALQLFVAHFGLDATPVLQKCWARTLYRWSKGWPKHLQNGLSVLGDALLATDGDLTKVDPMATQREAIARRIDYYQTRFGPLRDEPTFIGQVMAQLGHNPVPRRAINIAIRTTMQKGDWDDIEPPLFIDMLRQGLVDEITAPTNDMAYRCPIPSLRSFAVTYTGKPLCIGPR